MSDSLIEMYDRGFERDTIVWIAISREHWLKISDRVTQLRQELSLAEEGLANYQQENAQLREALLRLSVSAQRLSEDAALALARSAEPTPTERPK